MQIGKVIKNYRKKKNITQAEFGKIIGVNKQTISKWENNITVPSIYKIYEISNAIGITINEIFDEELQDKHIYSDIKTTYNIGLNSLLFSIHNFDSLFYFMDSFNAISKNLWKSQKYIGHMLLQDSYETESAEKNSLLIHDLYCDKTKGLFVVFSSDIINFPKDKIVKCEHVSAINNNMFIFNVFLDDYELSFVQFILVEFSE